MSASLPDSNIRDQMRDVLASPGPDSARSARPVAPPLEAAVPADALLEPWFSCLRDRLGPTRIFDCHTHLGCADPDGSCFGVDELLGALAAVDARAVVFPLAEPDGYRAANDRMLAAAQAAEGRLVAFCRADPHDGDAMREVERALARGAAGIKLHPRAERFELGDPAVRRILAVADERRLPVIVHAGRGIPSLGRDALELARAYPRAALILAHAAIADLAWIWRDAAGQRNLFFDTAWWNTADQLALFALVPPGQILFASDTPYGRTVPPRRWCCAPRWRRASAGRSRWSPAGSSSGCWPAPSARSRSRTRGAGAGPGTAAGTRTRAVGRGRRAADRRLSGRRVPGARRARVRATRRPSRRRCRRLGTRSAGPLRRLSGDDPPRRGPRVPGIHLIFVAAAIARTPSLPIPVLAE